jgi:hypothetical protein
MRDEEYRRAAARFPQLARAVCSAPWLLALVVPGPDRRTLQRVRDLYPFVPERDFERAADRGRWMQRCGVCGWISPRNEPFRCCCDWQIEREESDFQERLEQVRCQCEQQQLRNCRWRRPMTSVAFVAFVASPHSILRGIEALAAPAAVPGNEEESVGYPDDTGEPAATTDERRRLAWIDRELSLQVAHQRFGILAPTIRFMDPIPMSSLGHLPFGVAAEILSIGNLHDRRQARNARAVTLEYRRACRPLGDYKLTAKRGEILLVYHGRWRRLLRYRRDYPAVSASPKNGRALGCAFTILPEEEKKLVAEIAYFHKQGRKHPDTTEFERVIPSAKRFTRSNPMLRAREDKWSIEERFVTPDEEE